MLKSIGLDAKRMSMMTGSEQQKLQSQSSPSSQKAPTESGGEESKKGTTGDWVLVLEVWDAGTLQDTLIGQAEHVFREDEFTSSELQARRSSTASSNWLPVDTAGRLQCMMTVAHQGADSPGIAPIEEGDESEEDEELEPTNSVMVTIEEVH